VICISSCINGSHRGVEGETDAAFLLVAPNKTQVKSFVTVWVLLSSSAITTAKTNVFADFLL